MDLFDVIFTAAEVYTNTANDMKNNNGKSDNIEILCRNMLKGKKKVDKMYDDEINSYNRRYK